VYPHRYSGLGTGPLFKTTKNPPNYNIYRRDRRDGFGGVLIAVKADKVSDHLDVEINTE
jgi:hypothetical protein